MSSGGRLKVLGVHGFTVQIYGGGVQNVHTPFYQILTYEYVNARMLS